MGEHGEGIRVVARVLIQNAAGDLLLCRNRSGKAWVPPGGTLELGETLAQAALREAEEEAGLSAEIGRLVYLQEFWPAGCKEQVIEAAFLARARENRPGEARPESRTVEPAGPAAEPWRAWFIQDVDGPRREVRWFSRAEVAALPEPVYPPYLQDRLWAEGLTGPDAYLGLVTGK